MGVLFMRQAFRFIMTLLLVSSSARRGVVTAWVGLPRHVLASTTATTAATTTTTKTTTRCFMASDMSTDNQGRRIRKRRGGGGGVGSNSDENDTKNEWIDANWNDVPDNSSTSTSTSSRGRSESGWDDFDPLAAPQRQARQNFRRPINSYQNNNNNSNDSYYGSRRGGHNYSPRRGVNERGGRNFNQRRGVNERADDQQKKINLKALEGAGYDHLYGLAPVRNALRAQKREFAPLESRFLRNLNDDDEASSLSTSSFADETTSDKDDDNRKPEAQFRPYLFLQERRGKAGRSGDKSILAEQVQTLAQDLKLPIAYVDKGALNTLSGNRPHQGCVLRCGKLDFEPLSKLPSDADSPRFWLVLDQIVDPQNLGALLRSAYFFGHTAVLVCAKNSAPPSPVVSASSAGALEDMMVYATNNLPRTLATAEQEGFRIIGASATSPTDSDIPVYSLDDLPATINDNDVQVNRPTILVLGSEGHGIRPLVATYCTEFVKIPGADHANQGVDSLNVSVTGGILMWHLLQKVIV